MKNDRGPGKGAIDRVIPQLQGYASTEMSAPNRLPQKTQPESASRAKADGHDRSHRISERASRAADLYFAEGKSFRAAMLEGGYSPSIAAQGPKYNLRRNVSLRLAFERASHANLRPEQLKMLAVHRLASEIANPKRTDGVKPIEVLGKMKEFDWFVRNSDVRVGIFTSLAEEPPPVGNLDDYKD